MTISFSRIITPASEEAYLAWCLQTLGEFGFNVTSWQTGSRQRTLVQFIARGFANFHELVAYLGKSTINELSTGDALTAFSRSQYANERYAATTTQGKVVISDDAGVGPVTIALGAYVYEDETYRYTYRNTEAGVLPLSGTLELAVAAEVAGAARNVANGTITRQVTPIAGVSVSNPAIGTTGTWITASGTDEETDENLRERNTTKWPTLAEGTEPADAFVNWARSSAIGITRVKVDATNPDGPGTLDVYIAGPSGVAAGSDKTACQAVLTAKQGECRVATAELAAAQTQAFTATVYVQAQYFTGGSIQTAKKNEIEDAARAYVNGLDIGGTVLPPPDGDGATGYCLASEWKGAVTAVPGVVNVGSPTPSADVAIGEFSIMTVSSVTFAYVAV